MGYRETEEEGAVRLLGDRIGYGRTMQLCEEIWNAQQPGGAISTGPCVALLVPCSHPERDESGHCNWCCGSGRITRRVHEAQIRERSATDALRAFAIVNHWKGTGEYKNTAWGQRCRCCGLTWQRDTQETHRDNCPLKETE